MWSEANCFLAGAAWNAFGCYVSCPLAAGRHGGRPRCARGGGPWAHLYGTLGQVGNVTVHCNGVWPEEQE